MNKRMLLPGSLLTCCVLLQLAYAQKNQHIYVANNSPLALTAKAIVIKRAQIPSIPTGAFYPLILSAKGDTIPAQLDDLNRDNRWDELFFVVDLPARFTQKFSLEWVKAKPAFIKRTGVRFGKRSSASSPVRPANNEIMYARDMPKSLGFQRYQTDGPSWENDKVGFRHYLDGRNAKDVFGKRVSYLSPEDVGINAAGAVEDNYHVMAAWGRDILAVGNSVGIGGIALMKRDSIMRLGVTVDDSINNVEKTTFSIVSEGPVRSLMNFKYYNWKPGHKSYNAEETVSIWPGMYAYQNTVKISGAESNEQLLIGIVNINAAKPPIEIKVGEKFIALISHEKHAYNKEWWLGLALILPADTYLGFTEAPKKGKLSNSYLARLKMSGKPVSYYAVAGWELSDEGFKDPAYFSKYVVNLAKQLAAEVKVTVR
ncbi:MAG: DUF4861 domain-containing protein [Ferruginibacter sp.]|nr:DUF4861 domain-containing protein [Ferruginibacter sp.]